MKMKFYSFFRLLTRIKLLHNIFVLQMKNISCFALYKKTIDAVLSQLFESVSVCQNLNVN